MGDTLDRCCVLDAPWQVEGDDSGALSGEGGGGGRAETGGATGDDGGGVREIHGAILPAGPAMGPDKVSRCRAQPSRRRRYVAQPSERHTLACVVGRLPAVEQSEGDALRVADLRVAQRGETVDVRYPGRLEPIAVSTGRNAGLGPTHARVCRADDARDAVRSTGVRMARPFR